MTAPNMTTTAPHHPVPGYAAPEHTAETPWYRRAWVLAVSAVLIAALSFASGFIAGNATAFLNRLGGPGTSIDGPRFPDGSVPGDGELPQFPGDSMSHGDS